jgi:hypothetical protein
LIAGILEVLSWQVCDRLVHESRAFVGVLVPKS